MAKQCKVDLAAAKQEIKQLKEDFEDSAKRNAQLLLDNGELTTLNVTLKAQKKHADDQVKKLTSVLNLRDGTIVTTENTIKDLQHQLEEASNEISTGKASKSEKSEDVNDAIAKEVKENTFRNVKFARDKDLLDETDKMYDKIHSTLWPEGDESEGHLNKKEFRRIYQSEVSAALSERRQYRQNRMNGGAQGTNMRHDIGILCIYTKHCSPPPEWFDQHGTLPTLEEIESIWDIPDVPSSTNNGEGTTTMCPEWTEYNRKTEMLTWWIDCMVAMAAGNDDFGNNVRFFKMAVDKRQLPDNTRRQCVTVPTEAMAYLIYDNCRTKWLTIMEYRKNNKKRKLPKFNKLRVETHKYHCAKWSDSKTGQVKGGGWHPDSYKAFNTYVTKVKDFRKQDKRNKWKMYSFAKDLVRQKHEIEDEYHNTKRKRGNSKAASDGPVYDTLIKWTEDMEDEDTEDNLSVGSDD